MGFELTLFLDAGLVQKQAIDEVMDCNEYSRRFGLVLSAKEATELVETRSTALRGNGRIEFGGGVIDKLIKAFCDSPYLMEQNYVETLHELIEIFYYYKNETMDLISDDELISAMKTSFDGSCQGSLELLSGRELNTLARNVRFGFRNRSPKNSDSQEESDE